MSVTCIACARVAGDTPPVRSHISQRVDGAERELAARRGGARTGHVVEQPGELGAGEVGVEDEPGALAEKRLEPPGAQRSAGRRGAPVLPDDGVARSARRSRGSRATVVSRWLVMPIAAISLAASPDLASASRAVASCEVQISCGSCSTQPGCG